MAIWEKPGAEDARMLRQLVYLANGYDQHGNPVPPEVQMAAVEKYQQVKELQERRQLDAARLEADKQRIVGQANLFNAQAEAELRRVAVEEDRLDIERAEVVVKALQVAVEGGVSPEQLMSAIQGLSGRLLEGDKSNGEKGVALLEDKSDS